MVGEAIAGLSALKTAFDLAKGLKDIDDAARRNAAVIELQERILAGQQAQATLLERIGSLEKEVTGFQKWETEKEKYELKDVYSQNFAYVIKANARGAEPAHMICARCYEDRKKSILQKATSVHLNCPLCGTRIQFREANVGRSDYTPRF